MGRSRGGYEGEERGGGDKKYEKARWPPEYVTCSDIEQDDKMRNKTSASKTLLHPEINHT